MKLQIVLMLVGNIFKLISPNMVRDAVNAIIDLIETQIAKTENTIDDAIAIPIIAMLRQTFAIPDRDGSPLIVASHEGKVGMIISLLTSLLGIVTPDMLKSCIDSLLDVIENFIADSETKTDDAMLLPLIVLIRDTFDIPDNDPVPAVAN